MRFTTLSVAGLFLGAVFAFAMWPQDARFGAPDLSVAQSADPFGGSNTDSSELAGTEVQAKRRRTAATRIVHSTANPTQLTDQTRDRLKQPVNLDFDEVPFSDIEAELERRLGVNLLLDQSALDDSLTADEPITIQLRDVPCDYALRLMLGPKNATYFVEAGIIRIISRDVRDESEFFARKIFNVTDLLHAIDSWGKKGNAIGIGTESAVPEKPKPSGGGVFCLPDAVPESREANVKSVPNSSEILSRLLCRSTGEEQWTSSGANRMGSATHSLICGQLVVFGPEALIGDVDAFLADLRAKLKSD